jgi:hypothetical protein
MSLDRRHHLFSVVSQGPAPFLLSGEGIFNARELVRLLTAAQFVERNQSGQRRLDAEVVLKCSPDCSRQVVDIRLMAYSSGSSGAITMILTEGTVEISSCIIRESKFTADDRSQFLIANHPTNADRPIIDNVILGASVCVGRGTVRPLSFEDANPSDSRRGYHLFLPSMNPLPYFDADFNVIGLPSAY